MLAAWMRFEGKPPDKKAAEPSLRRLDAVLPKLRRSYFAVTAHSWL